MPPAGLPIEQVLGEYSLCLCLRRRDVAFYSIPPEPRIAYELGGTCAFDLFPNFPEYKTPTSSYETHPNDLKFG